MGAAAVNLGQLIGQLRLRIDTLEEENAELRRLVDENERSAVKCGRPMRIVQAIQGAGRWMTSREIVAALSVSGEREEHAIYVVLNQMTRRRRQLIRRGAHGKLEYGLPEWATDQ